MDVGLSVVVYDHRWDGFTNMWVTPAWLGDRVDPNALRHRWQALAAADTDRDRATWIMEQATKGLNAAFAADLTAPPVTRQAACVGVTLPKLPWWDEHSTHGIVMLGSILGYPAASTYTTLLQRI